MSTTDPGASSGASTTKITLPPGVMAGAPRETSQTNQQGQVQQGMLFPFTLPSGGTTSVFVPYTLLGQTAVVQQLISDRINAIMAVTG